MKLSNLPYLAIIVLIVIVFLQNKGCNEDTPINTVDTVTVYIHTVDTVYGKPEIVYTKSDTIWLKDTLFIPDTTYTGLLNQYTKLGNKYFTTNVFSTKFDISDYGSVTVTDTIYGNWLMGSSLITDLTIPVTTITVEKEAPSRRQLYGGPRFTGNSTLPVSGVYGDLLLKTKKDRIYGISIGYTGEIQFGGSLYYPIKIK
jgi:hypothetical protein